MAAGSASARDLDESFWGAGAAFVVDAVVTVAVTLVTKPKPVEELQGLVYGMANVDEEHERRAAAWWESRQAARRGAFWPVPHS